MEFRNNHNEIKDQVDKCNSSDPIPKSQMIQSTDKKGCKHSRKSKSIFCEPPQVSYFLKTRNHHNRENKTDCTNTLSRHRSVSRVDHRNDSDVWRIGDKKHLQLYHWHHHCAKRSSAYCTNQSQARSNYGQEANQPLQKKKTQNPKMSFMPREANTCTPRQRRPNMPSDAMIEGQRFPNMPPDAMNPRQRMPNMPSDAMNPRQRMPNMPSDAMNPRQRMPNMPSDAMNQGQRFPNMPPDAMSPRQRMPNMPPDAMSLRQRMPNMPPDAMNQGQRMPRMPPGSLNEMQRSTSSKPKGMKAIMNWWEQMKKKYEDKRHMKKKMREDRYNEKVAEKFASLLSKSKDDPTIEMFKLKNELLNEENRWGKFRNTKLARMLHLSSPTLPKERTFFMPSSTENLKTHLSEPLTERYLEGEREIARPPEPQTAMVGKADTTIEETSSSSLSSSEQQMSRTDRGRYRQSARPSHMPRPQTDRRTQVMRDDVIYLSKVDIGQRRFLAERDNDLDSEVMFRGHFSPENATSSSVSLSFEEEMRRGNRERGHSHRGRPSYRPRPQMHRRTQVMRNNRRHLSEVDADPGKRLSKEETLKIASPQPTIEYLSSYVARPDEERSSYDILQPATISLPSFVAQSARTSLSSHVVQPAGESLSSHAAQASVQSLSFNVAQPVLDSPLPVEVQSNSSSPSSFGAQPPAGRVPTHATHYDLESQPSFVTQATVTGFKPSLTSSPAPSQTFNGQQAPVTGFKHSLTSSPGPSQTFNGQQAPVTGFKPSLTSSLAPTQTFNGQQAPVTGFNHSLTSSPAPSHPSIGQQAPVTGFNHSLTSSSAPSQTFNGQQAPVTGFKPSLTSSSAPSHPSIGQQAPVTGFKPSLTSSPAPSQTFNRQQAPVTGFKPSLTSSPAPSQIFIGSQSPAASLQPSGRQTPVSSHPFIGAQPLMDNLPSLFAQSLMTSLSPLGAQGVASSLPCTGAQAVESSRQPSELQFGTIAKSSSRTEPYVHLESSMPSPILSEKMQSSLKKPSSSRTSQILEQAIPMFNSVGSTVEHIKDLLEAINPDDRIAHTLRQRCLKDAHRWKYTDKSPNGKQHFTVRRKSGGTGHTSLWENLKNANVVKEVTRWKQSPCKKRSFSCTRELLLALKEAPSPPRLRTKRNDKPSYKPWTSTEILIPCDTCEGDNFSFSLSSGSCCSDTRDCHYCCVSDCPCDDSSASCWCCSPRNCCSCSSGRCCSC